MNSTETVKMEEALNEWFDAFSLGFITQISGSGSYSIKAQFRTMQEMHDAYDKMARLAKLSRKHPFNMLKPSNTVSRVDKGDGE